MNNDSREDFCSSPNSFVETARSGFLSKQIDSRNNHDIEIAAGWSDEHHSSNPTREEMRLKDLQLEINVKNKSLFKPHYNHLKKMPVPMLSV